MRHEPPAGSGRPALAAAAAALALTLGACASPPKPTADIAAASSAVSQAESADAPVRAPAELQAARIKLQEAQKAADEEDYERARRLAEQAELDARLSELKSENAATREALAQLRADIRGLKADLDRR